MDLPALVRLTRYKGRGGQHFRNVERSKEENDMGNIPVTPAETIILTLLIVAAIGFGATLAIFYLSRRR